MRYSITSVQGLKELPTKENAMSGGATEFTATSKTKILKRKPAAWWRVGWS
jgi:hypothetical protein